MFGFTVLLSSLARIAGQTRCLFLDDEPRMIRPTLINLNPVQLKYIRLYFSAANKTWQIYKTNQNKVIDIKKLC